MSKMRDQGNYKPQTPINFGVRSNGEFFEAPSEKDTLIEKLVLERAEVNSKRLGVDRRSFLGSAAGMATTLAVVNLVHGCGDGDDDAPAAAPSPTTISRCCAANGKARAVSRRRHFIHWK